MGVRRGRMPKNEAGFTVLECIIALSLVFVVLLVLLSALTSGFKGLVTGRQRSVALAVANEVLENARGRAYIDIGHDFDSDPTLAAGQDSDITGIAPNLSYKGEPLVGSTVDAGAGGGTTSNPLFPFSPHRWNSARDGTTYTTNVYVTMVVPTTKADPYKRLTVKVSWSPAQASTRSVTLSSYLYNAAPPPDPRLTGQGEASAGTFSVCVSVQDCSDPDPLQLNLLFPQVSGVVDSGFVKLANGSATTGSTQLDVLSGTVTSCTLLGDPGVCESAKADASADDDSGTIQPETDKQGPISNGPSFNVSGAGLTATLGSGSVQAQAAGRSCTGVTCSGPAVGDNDWLPYFLGTANGTGGVSVGYSIPGLPALGTLSGSLLSLGTTCPAPTTPAAAATNTCGTTVEVDRDNTGGNPTLTTTASTAYPSIAVMTLPGLLNGMIKVTSGWITATATASGPTATSAAVTASPNFKVSFWNGLAYTDVNVTPGVAQPDIHKALTIGLAGLSSVDLDATVHVNGTTSTNTGPDVNGLKASSATSGGWLVVDLHFTVQTVLGTLADFWLHLDLGQVAASASYQAYTVGS